MGKNYQVIKRELYKKLESNGHFTQDDLREAAGVAKAFGGVEDRVLYTNIKRKVEEEQ